MTSYSGACQLCKGLCDWIDCPTGGWWSHRAHPADDHDAQLGWRPMERQTDRGDWETQ